ncbi:MAG TPA: hypothetical protein VIX59_01190 [Candidatus Binataceae bacterium]|jgi:hypothetical protein
MNEANHRGDISSAGAHRVHQVCGCWRMERSSDGRYRPRLFLIADGNLVIAEAVLDFPTLEAGRVLAATISNMINQQPPEILRSS